MKKKQFGFLVNKSDAARRLSSKNTLLLPVPRSMAIMMQKVALLEVFHHHTAKTKFIEKLADLFDRFAEPK